MMPRVTVAIVSFNEEKNILATLKSLYHQSQLNIIEEILVIDNQSTDATTQIVQEYSDQNASPEIRLIRNLENNLGSARALAVKECKSPWLAFIDADCEAPPEWIKTLADNLIDDLAGACAPNRLPENSLWLKAINDSLETPLGHGYSPQAWKPKSAQLTDHLPTTNCILNVKMVLAAGNFDSLQKYCGEDLELGLRLRKFGKLVLLPQPLVINKSCHSFNSWLTRLVKFGQTRAQVFVHKNSQWPLIATICLVGPLVILCLFLIPELKETGLIFFSLYFLTNLSASLISTYRRKRLLLFPICFATLMTSQIAYGFGFLKGLICPT